MQIVNIHTADIQLDQLLKLSGIVQSGGEVKGLVNAGQVIQNGELVTARRKKIKVGDIVKVLPDVILKVASE